MSSSSSSSSEAKWPFDVFINFRGKDVRYGFVADLHKCLLHGGINAYIDSEDLRPGDEISPALTKAIEESRIAVLVFSENYASSKWCLDELVKVMEYRRLKGQWVLPVFYKVEPREVRRQRKSYGKALARHEKKLGKDSEGVKKWREALFKAGNLSGWHYVDGQSQDDTKFIESIVKKISTLVRRVPLSVAKYPVGVGRRKKKVMSLLNMGSDNVWMIGIWGTGGKGKTTIAKAVYNSIADQFDGCTFLPNVRETSGRSDGLVRLQEKLLSEILWKENIAVLSVDGGANLIQDRLCCRKILLVLDDVDHGDQLNALARERKWFGKGSKIIITTRDKHVLTSHGIHHVYEVEPLYRSEALELLSSHAFSRNQTKDISMDLIGNILGYANGLPLAIVVLGSLLCGRSREEWESTLKKLVVSPNKNINSILKISFDSLEDNERDIFLDIACFFNGRKRDYVTRVLDSCGLQTLIGIQTLIERSLVTIEYDGRVQMHDLIQLMGQDVVKKECPNDPGKRSRLWCYNDVNEVLFAATGTNDVKGIVLQLQRPAVLHISRGAFTRMRRLKLLILSNARISGGPVCLPDDLRWLEWHKCHSSTLKFSDDPKELVCFDVRGSRIKKFGGNLKDFNKLKFITLIQCQSLICMPDISCTPNLEKLYLETCKNLERVHESIACHGKLWSLSLSGCSNLQSFPDISVKNEALLEVFLINTGIKELPASIENLISLKRMYLMDSKKLAILPSSIYRLQNLEILQLNGCSRLIKFPKEEEEEEDLSEHCSKTGFPMLSLLSLGWCHLSEVEFLDTLSSFPRLRELYLQGNNFTDLPTCEKLYNLEGLDVSGCQQLQKIPKLPKKLRRLRATSCKTSCKSLSRLPSKICDVERVELYSSQALVHNGVVNDYFKDLGKRVDLTRCESLVEVDQSVGYLDKLEVLSLESCFNLSIFPSILKTKSLCELYLSGCSKLKKFSDIPEKIEHLKRLVLTGMANKELPASINNLVSVEHIRLGNCKNFARLPSSIYKLQNLRYLEITDCPNFITFPKNLEDPTHLDDSLGFSNLDRLDLQRCNLSELDFLEGSSNFPKLTSLNLSENKFTHTPRCFRKYDNLEDLYLNNCKQLQEIPQLPSNIGIIRAQNCRSLQNLPDFSSVHNFFEVDFSSCCGLSRKEFDLAGVSILEYLRKAKRKVEILLIGGEMPGWIHHCEEGSISFKVPDDLHDKFLGLALCVVFGLEEAKVLDVQLQVDISINGEGIMSSRYLSLESYNVWLEYCPRKNLYNGEDQQNGWSHFEVCLRVSKGSIKQCGFRLICQQQEDDLRVKPHCPHLIETNWLLKERDSEDDLRVKPHCPHLIETNWLLKERDSEEDNSIDTREEDSPIETDGEES